jgi:hypothetical protein
MLTTECRAHLHLKHILDRPKSVFRYLNLVDRTAGSDRPGLLDAATAHADIPVVEVDGRVAVTGDQPDLVAEPKPVGGGRNREPVVLVGGTLVGRGGLVAEGPAVDCCPQLATDAGDGFGRVDDRDAGMAAEREESASPVMIRSACDAVARASTASSEGSRLTGAGSRGASMISANRLSSPSVGSRSVLERARISWNFGRFMTSASSASNVGY